MAALPPFPSLQAFEAVARRRSFALAASELHLTASAISHQVARLESHLGSSRHLLNDLRRMRVLLLGDEATSRAPAPADEPSPPPSSEPG